MAIAPLVVAVRTTGANTLNNVGTGLRRLAANARVAGNSMTNNLIRRGGLANTTLGRLAGSATRAGQAFATGLTRSIQNAMQSLPAAVTPQTVAAGAAIAAVLAPALGAALNGALLAAVGGGILAGAVAIAAKNSNLVQSAFSKAFTPMKADVTNFALMFESSLVRSAQVFGATWVDIGDDVRRIFGSLVDSVEPLARGLAGMAERALPGIEAAARASGPVLRELAKVLPGLGAAVGDMFKSFADGSDGAVKGIRYLIIWLSGVLIAVGNTVEFLSKAFDSITDKAEKFAQMLADIPVIGGAFQGLADKMGVLNGSIDGSARAMEGAQGATNNSADALSRQADAARKAGEAAVALSSRLSALLGDQMTAQQAAIAWEAAIDAVTASLQENGRTTDIGIEKGRQNVTTILDAVAAANAKREADIQLAGGERATAAAVEAANAKFRLQLGELEAVLRKAGLTDAQVDALLTSYQDLANAPPVNKTINVTTYYRTVGDARAAGDLGNLAPGGPNVGYASGTPSARRGLAMVGEEGPELVQFGGGERVFTATDTARILAGQAGGAGSGGGAGGGGGGYWPPAPTNAARGLLRALEKAQRQQVRTRARGNAQVYLGSSSRR